MTDYIEYVFLDTQNKVIAYEMVCKESLFSEIHTLKEMHNAKIAMPLKLYEQKEETQ